MGAEGQKRAKMGSLLYKTSCANLTRRETIAGIENNYFTIQN